MTTTVKFEACNEFVLGNYMSFKDKKSVKYFTEEQIMAALGKSKEFMVRDWFGDMSAIIFTITNIVKNKHGDYIYTIESNNPTNEDYFPLPYTICKDCEGCENIALPISYSI